MYPSQMIDATAEAAIHAVVQAVEDGWNAGDGDAFAASFVPDADYVVVNGSYIQGRPTIAKGHHHLFAGMYKDSHNHATVHDIRFLREDVAVAHVEWNLEVPLNPVVAAMAKQMPHMKNNGKTVTSQALCTMVMTQENGRWHIVAFHNTPVQSQ